MNRKFLGISVALCLCPSMSACYDGGLDCDVDSHEPECLSLNSYIYCRDGVLTTVKCDSESFCEIRTTSNVDGTVEKSASCKPIDSAKPLECETNDD